MIGEIISEKYKIESAISESHMYEIFQAFEIATGSHVVFKILREEMSLVPDRIRRFSEEIRSFASISHENVAEILDIDLYENRPYVVTEKVDGIDLHELMKSADVSFEKSIKIIEQLANLLKHAAEKEIEHRTIKLSNVLVDSNDNLKVISFTHPRLKIAGKSHRGGDSKVQSDLFFLGTTLFELLANESPIRKRGGVNELWDMKLEKSLRIRHQELEPKQIDALVELVDKTLTRNFKLRFAGIDDFIKALNSVIGKLRKEDIRKKVKELSMASQVVDALNGRMTDMNSSMSAKPVQAQTQVQAVSKPVAVAKESKVVKAQIDSKATATENLVAGNLALKSDNAVKKSPAPKLTVVKPQVEKPKKASAAKAELWQDEQERHWLANPMLIMGSSLLIMMLLVLFW